MRAILSVSDRGVLTLPTKLRSAIGLTGSDQVIAETTAEGLLLRPCVTLPIEMYSKERVAEFDASEADLEEALRRKELR